MEVKEVKNIEVSVLNSVKGMLQQKYPKKRITDAEAVNYSLEYYKNSRGLI